MFFVGIFGVQPGQKVLYEGSGVCPSCEAFDRHKVIQAYTYFHFFFIPLWKWNKHYFVETRCCRHTLEIDPAIGERYARGEAVQLKPEHIVRRTDSYREPICPSCGARVRSDFQFCPHCGTQLS
ncbi:MAG: zinc ribbon domain-containing protein [Firmicutes bacterium]|nr:zinc ribbon domain-containing protein [Bacillota bacterium]